MESKAKSKAQVKTKAKVTAKKTKSLDPVCIGKNTPVVREVIKTLSSVKFKNEYLKEIKKLHSDRTAGKLHKKKNINVRHIREALLLDQAFRSRIVLIKVEVNKIVNDLNIMYDGLLTTLMLSEYPIPITSKVKADRKEWISNFVDGIFPMLTDLNTILETADYVIEDIDKASWSLKNSLMTFELVTRPELNI